MLIPDRRFTRRKGMVSKQHNKAILFFDDEAAREIWIPHSLIESFDYEGHIKLSGPDELFKDEEVELTIPKWLLRKEGIAA